MQKTVEVVKSEFSSVRAGRANAGVLDRIMVDYYGSPTPIQQIAAISSPDARTLVISPWDTKLLKDIQKAIQISDLGINPQNDGSVIRLTFPPLTEDRRKELVKDIQKIAENAKVAARSISRDCLEKLNVKPIKAEGEQFDPNFHNAVMHVEDEEVGENIVVEEFQKGYMYKESVVRHSMVKVAN